MSESHSDLRQAVRPSRARKRRLLGMAALVAVVLITAHPRSARASFHLWDIVEVFSSADGSIQYIELATSSEGQQVLGGRDITATSTTDGVVTVRTFEFPSNLATGGVSTASERFLIGTRAFANLAGGVMPDYTLPCGHFFDPDADTIVVNFASVDTVTLSGPLPDDGQTAVNHSDQDVAATPERFNASAGSLMLTECLNNGSCADCDDGNFCNGAETCSPSGCPGTNPCPEQICLEEANLCVDCELSSDCNDGNPCTTDTCTGNSCSNTEHTNACDDGLFCTSGDVCSEGACNGVGDTCTGDLLCDENTNACVECLTAGDCDDGLFCNGVETCAGGSCNSGPVPCPGGGCSEGDDACVECTQPSECDDGNPCTDDACSLGVCEHSDNTASCSDGLFCTASDVCSEGTCSGSGEACPGENCLEGLDACGECTANTDCDDGKPCTANTCSAGVCQTADAAEGEACGDNGIFCDGVEVCAAGRCTSPGNPCHDDETCDDSVDVCLGGCSDGGLDPDEGCDDGNTTPFDGCSPTCDVEDGWSCSADPGRTSLCSTDCGDGIPAAGGEECDDANSAAGDGCNASCIVEPGWSCLPQGGSGSCAPIVGDGLVRGDEQCDDGNDQSGDGCSDGLVEPGFECSSEEPSPCDEVPLDGGDGGDPDDRPPSGEPSGDGGGCQAIDRRPGLPLLAALWLVAAASLRRRHQS